MPYLTNKDLKLLTNFTKKYMKLRELINSVESLNYLLDKDLPMVLSRKIAKVGKEANEELQEFNKIKENKIKELGEEVMDEEGNPTGRWQVKEENLETWNKEIEEIFNQDVEINVPEIKSEEFIDSEGKPILIKPTILNSLDWLINE